jgi:hypothetical protein
LSLVFDGAWYLARYPDVLGAGLDPLGHLLGSGLAEGRDPGPYVDLSYVGTLLPSVAGAPEAVLAHVLDRGLAEGLPTSPFIDLAWYGRQQSLDGATPDELFTHLVTEGRRHDLAPSPFVDLRWYAEHHAAIRLTGVHPFDYLVSVGQWLGRFPHPLWDESAYILGNEYVRYAVGVGKYATGFEHFCATGHTEVARGAVALPVRIAGVLDEYAEDRYLAANPDVVEAIESGSVQNGVTHLFGAAHHHVGAGVRRLKLPMPIATATVEPGLRPPRHEWLVIIVHFDVDGAVDPHVLTAIDTYLAAGADICVVTVDLEDVAIGPLRERCTHLVRKSSNDDLRDFGSWNLALDHLGDASLNRYPKVILTNDSTYFPARDPGAFLARLHATPADVFAATDSLSGGRYHLQSYFLALSPNALRVLRPEIARRVAEQAGATKLSLIQRFEVGLSEFILEQGLTTEAFCSIAAIDDVAAALSPPDTRPISQLAVSVTNLTHHFWRHTLDSGLPFLKVELLRDNPVEVDIDGWEAVVDGDCTADVITAHLARVRR